LSEGTHGMYCALEILVAVLIGRVLEYQVEADCRSVNESLLNVCYSTQCIATVPRGRSLCCYRKHTGQESNPLVASMVVRFEHQLRVAAHARRLCFLAICNLDVPSRNGGTG
jgi:hypothetical protein